jgi:hypothetical protein
VRFAFAGWVAATAINVRHILHRSAGRAAILAVAVGLTAAIRMSAFLVGGHLYLLLRMLLVFFSISNSSWGLMGRKETNL